MSRRSVLKRARIRRSRILAIPLCGEIITGAVRWVWVRKGFRIEKVSP